MKFRTCAIMVASIFTNFPHFLFYKILLFGCIGIPDYQPTNGLANTRTIAITIAIIGMDSIRPTEMNMVT